MTEDRKTEILIVEDSPTQAEQLQHILEGSGYHPLIASNGREALDILGRRRPAIVVSDIVMPEMDGFDLCMRIKADERFKGIPVILLTALSGPEDVLRALQSGADSFITKPYDEEYLLARIRHVLLNLELRKTSKTRNGTQISFKGEKYHISSGRQQILDLLLSTYETAVMKNRQLKEAQDKLKVMNEQLESEIAERSRKEEEVRRLNEDLRRRAMQLEEANKDLESFSFSISHDLKAPLRALTGFSSMLLDDHARELQGEACYLLEAIGANAKNMARLIDDILAFSRAGGKEIELNLIDIGNIVKDVIEEVKPSVEGRTVRFDLGELPSAMGDCPTVRQVFFNLIANAVKFTRPRDEAIIEIRGEESGDEITYYVKDNGVGFNPAYSDKLFGLFQRLHSAKEFEGTGIGLASIKRIVNKLGGRVWATGSPDEGASFYFTLRKI